MTSRPYNASSASLTDEQKNKITFEEIVSPYKSDLDHINKIIEDRYSQSLPIIKKIGHHHFQSGGKRIRPLLTMIFSRLLGADPKRSSNLAACIELIHSASLVHDDVLDESMQRRGKASVNAIWDNRVSILMGDYLFSQAFSCMVEAGSPEVYKILAEASISITEGELYQISIQRNLETPFSSYEYMVEKKTASLFEAACSIPGAIIDISEKKKESLKKFGKMFGHIFQMVDDLLDYTGKTNIIGKKIGKDLEEGKVTFPVLYTYEKSSKEEKLFWQQIFHEGYCASQKDLEKVCALLEKYNAKFATSKILIEYKNQAFDALSCFNVSNQIEDLKKLITFMINREF